MKRFKLILASLLMSLSFMTLPATAIAGPPCPSGGAFLGFPTWYKYLESEDGLIGGKCTPKIERASDALPVVVALVEILLRLAGLVAVGYVVYGGIRYIMSQGQPDATKSARQTITNALIGVVITIVASSAVSFFGSTLT